MPVSRIPALVHEHSPVRVQPIVEHELGALVAQPVYRVNWEIVVDAGHGLPLNGFLIARRTAWACQSLSAA